MELLADDPEADPADTAALEALGYGSQLVLPIIRDGVPIARVEAYAYDTRPWTRFEIGRARIISHHLSAVLERTVVPV